MRKDTAVRKLEIAINKIVEVKEDYEKLTCFEQLDGCLDRLNSVIYSIENDYNQPH